MIPSGCEKRCPGCRHREFSREQSEGVKRDFLSDKLAPFLAQGAVLAPVEGVSDPARVRYRERVCLRAQWDGRWKFGLRVFRKPVGQLKRVEEVIDIPSCPIHSWRVQDVHRVLARCLPSDFPILYVLVSGALLTLVVKASRSDSIQERANEPGFAESLRRIGIEGVFLNFNPSAGERVLSSRGWSRVWGNEWARDAAGFWHGPDSFQQLIPSLHRQALATASEFLDPSPKDSLIDLYSGGGISMALWETKGARSVGVELGGEAIRCSERNLSAAKILRGRTSDRVPQLRDWLRHETAGGRRLLFTNPPRLGMEASVTRWIAEEMRPERIAYLSCSAGTLARDLSVLRDSGYALRKVIPYDFFPGTHHVEALALVERLA